MIKKTALLRAAAILSFFAVWEAAALLINESVLLPSPREVAACLFSLLGEWATYQTFFISLGRVFLGFFAGLVCAVLLSLLSCRFPRVKPFLLPYLSLARAVPVTSFIVLFMIWLDAASLTPVISFLMVLPLVYANLLGALEARDRRLDEMAQVYSFSYLRRLLFVWLPQVRPALLSSATAAVGLAWKAGVASELIGLVPHSIGDRIYLSKLYLDTPALFAWTVLIVGGSLLTEKLFVRFLSAFTKGGRLLGHTHS